MQRENLLQLDVPKGVKGKDREDFLATAQEVLREQIVLRWFEAGKVSAGYAASILALSRDDFERLLSKNRISPFNYAAEELEEDFRAAAKLAGKLKSKQKSRR